MIGLENTIDCQLFWDLFHREGKERAVVVISSAGGIYKGEGSDMVQDFLNPYLR